MKMKDVTYTIAPLNSLLPGLDAISLPSPSSRPPESLAGRLLAAKLIGLPPEQLPGFLTQESPSFRVGSLYWSSSHKRGHIAAAVSKHPIGIDIEIIHPRSKSLFAVHSAEDWKALGGKSWENFYKGWVLKEAFLKALSLPLGQVTKVRLQQSFSSGVFQLSFNNRSLFGEASRQGSTCIGICAGERSQKKSKQA